MADLDAQDAKYILSKPPAALIDNASAAVTEIDTNGYSACEILVLIGATDIGITALAVTESDTAGSGHANVTGLIWGTSADIASVTSTVPSATDDNKIFKFEIDLRSRKRYLDVTCTVGNGTAGGYVTILTRLSNPDVSPATAAEAGCAQILRV